MTTGRPVKVGPLRSFSRSSVRLSIRVLEVIQRADIDDVASRLFMTALIKRMVLVAAYGENVSLFCFGQ